tara:strand:- start:41 stop:217 length:177 start_codon:yes stop_codon:yes gene_type:complete
MAPPVGLSTMTPPVPTRQGTAAQMVPGMDDGRVQAIGTEKLALSSVGVTDARAATGTS